MTWGYRPPVAGDGGGGDDGGGSDGVPETPPSGAAIPTTPVRAATFGPSAPPPPPMAPTRSIRPARQSPRWPALVVAIAIAAAIAVPIVVSAAGDPDVSGDFDASEFTAFPALPVPTVATAPVPTVAPEPLPPVAIGTAADLGDGWTLTVHGVDRDADVEIAAANEFNPPPPVGSHFVLVDVEIVNRGDDARLLAASLQLEFVDGAGASHTPFECSVVPAAIPFDPIPIDTPVRGNLCFPVPAEAIAAGVVSVTVFARFGDPPRTFTLT